MEVEVDLVRCDHAVDRIGFGSVVSLKEIGQRRGFSSSEPGQDLFRHFRGGIGAVGSQIVLDEPDVVLKDPVDSGRGPDPVGKPELGGRSLSGRTDPSAPFVFHVSVRHFLCKPDQILFGLAFDEFDPVPADDEEVRDVGNSQISSVLS